MTRTEARLALSFRQRRFEWELARDEQTRAAAKLVAGKTHDLLNLIQIVQLATLELEKHCDLAAREFLDDLVKAAADAQASMTALMAVARPDQVIVRGAPVGAAVDAALSTLRDAIAIDVHLATPPDTATRCTADELEHLLIGMALDVAAIASPTSSGARSNAERCGEAIASPTSGGARSNAERCGEVIDERVELYVRERAIDGVPWIEIVRSTPRVPDGERFELRVVEAIASKAGGEVTRSDRRGGGEELVVALPVV